MTNYEKLIKEIATPRQYQAWRYRKMKMTRRNIAAKMNIAPSTVSHLRRRLKKRIERAKKLIEISKKSAETKKK